MDVFLRLIKLIRRLSPSQKIRIQEAVGKYPSHLFASRVLKPLQEHLTLALHTYGFYSEPVTIYCVALHWLYQINREKKYSIVPVTLFNNAAVSSLSSNMLVKVTPLLR